MTITKTEKITVKFTNRIGEAVVVQAEGNEVYVSIDGHGQALAISLEDLQAALHALANVEAA